MSPTPRLSSLAMALVAAFLSGAVALQAAAAGAVVLPPANKQFDYQLGGAYTPLSGVAIVVRDRLERAIKGKYNVCYVNAFQTQPADGAWWRKNHPTLLVQKGGTFVVDPDWPDEYILDVSTTAKRSALLAIVGPWIDNCARDGFAAIEPDNLDSWVRSQSVLRKQHNIAFATLLAKRAHASGLAIAQKNASDLAPIGTTRIGFDFAIVEECQVWDECDAFTAVYGTRVYEIEYNDNDEDMDGNPVKPIAVYNAACAKRGAKISVIYRDRDVVPAGRRGYEYKWC